MQVSIHNLQKYYDGRLVLDIGNLDFKNGKITGIVGPNGAGKTALLNIIGGLDRDFKGVVRYDGKCLDNNVQKDMTLVFQKVHLFRRTVYENIEYPLKVRDIPNHKRAEKVENALNKLEISDLKHKKGNLLSGGETQKVALARALVFMPELLLLDEPTSNIDPESINVMEKEIIYFNKEAGATVIIVTHNILQAKRICNEVIYLEKGKVGSLNGFF